MRQGTETTRSWPSPSRATIRSCSSRRTVNWRNACGEAAGKSSARRGCGTGWTSESRARSRRRPDEELWTRAPGRRSGSGALAELGAQLAFEGGALRTRGRGPHRRQHRVPRVTLGVPLVGERSGVDAVDDLAHRRRDVVVIEAVAARQLAVLAGGGVVPELRRVATLPHEAVRALDLAGEHELGDDRLDRDPVLEHHLCERLRHAAERR